MGAKYAASQRAALPSLRLLVVSTRRLSCFDNLALLAVHKATIHSAEKNEQACRRQRKEEGKEKKKEELAAGRSISRVGAVIYLPLCVMWRREEGGETALR